MQFLCELLEELAHLLFQQNVVLLLDFLNPFLRLEAPNEPAHILPAHVFNIFEVIVFEPINVVLDHHRVYSDIAHKVDMKN